MAHTGFCFLVVCLALRLCVCSCARRHAVGVRFNVPLRLSFGRLSSSYCDHPETGEAITTEQYNEYLRGKLEREEGLVRDLVNKIGRVREGEREKSKRSRRLQEAKERQNIEKVEKSMKKTFRSSISAMSCKMSDLATEALSDKEGKIRELEGVIEEMSSKHEREILSERDKVRRLLKAIKDREELQKDVGRKVARRDQITDNNHKRKKVNRGKLF